MLKIEKKWEFSAPSSPHKMTILKMPKIGKFGQILDFRASLFSHKTPKNKNETKPKISLKA